MGLILDTSAVIGWVERQSPALLTYLREHVTDARPVVHVVSLGELERGVAEATNDRDREQRVGTLTFARSELEPLDLRAGDPALGGQPQAFGTLAGVLSRQVSHNDCWITAGAIVAGHTLVTQDENLAEGLHRAPALPVRGHGTFDDWLKATGKRLDVALCPI